MPHASTLSPGLRVRSLFRPLCAVLITCGLLTGFAAQVPSPPPPAPAPAAAPRPHTAPTPAQAPATPQVTPIAPQEAPPSPEAPVPSQAAAPITPPAPAPVPAAPEEPRAALAAQVAQAIDPAAVRSPVAVRDHFEYFLDESFALALQDVMTGSLNFLRWQSPFPRKAGALWLRLKLTPMPTGLPDQIYLHLGAGIPGTPSVWMTRPGSPLPVTVRPEEAGIYPILYSQVGGTLFIKLDTWPAAGFAPWIGRLDADAEASVSISRYAVLALLGLAALLCLVRGLIERREWRIWAGLFALAALIQGIWGQPSLPGGRLNPWDIPSIVAAALALFILPHAGRILMRPRNTMPWLDKLFIGTSLLGLAAGLAPLLPGQSWLLRWLTLWPLGIAVTLLLTLAACRRGLAGCGRYLFACLLAVFGVLPLIAPLIPMQPSHAPWFGLAPLCGLACSALLLSLVGGHPEPRAAVPRRSGSRRPQQDDNELDLQLDLPAPDDSSDPLPDKSLELTMFKKRDKQRDTNVPLTKPDVAAPATSARTAEAAGSVRRSEPLRSRPAPDADMDTDALIRLEEALRVPLDALLRQSIALDMQPLPVGARQYVKELVAAGRTLTNIITNLSRTGLPQTARVTVENALLDLPLLLRDAHAAVSAEAEDRNLAVSWYVAPHIGRRYVGPADRLSHLLMLLMENAIRATDSGAIQLWARRVQDSNDPGHIVFTVTDTGSGMPPTRRNALLAARVWELVGEMDGTVHIDSGPSGTSISFSVVLKVLPARAAQLPDSVIASPEALLTDEEALALPSLRIILADDTSSRRQLLAYMLEDLPHEILEARSASEAVSMHAEVPARLIVFDGNMPEKDLIDAIAAVRSLDGERDLPPAALLALVGHEAQGERLRRAGMNHILYKPVNRPILRQTVLHMAPVPGLELPPLPLSQAPAPTVDSTPDQPAVDQLAHSAPDPAADPQAAAAPSSEARAFEPLAMPGEQPGAAPEASAREGAVQLKPPASDTAVLPKLRTPSASPAGGAPDKQAQANQEAVDELPLPAHSPRTSQPQRKRGLFERLLGVLPSRRASLPDVHDGEQEQDTTPKLVSRSVGEPRPIPRSERPAEATKVTRPERPAYTPPRLTMPSDDSLLSENGVGEPKPIPKAKPTDNTDTFSPITDFSLEDHLSENGVGEPMPLPKKVEAKDTPNPLRLELEPLAEASTEQHTEADIHTAEDPNDVAPASTPLSLTSNEGLPPLGPPVSRRRPSLLDLIQFVEPEAQESPQEAPAPLLLTTLTDSAEPDESPQAAATAALAGPSLQEAERKDPVRRADDGDTIVLELLHTLDDALFRVQDALARNDAQSVITATGQMADHAERFGLHVLARLARGMQDMAAEPEGLEAVADTMPDLRAAVERNRISFTAR